MLNVLFNGFTVFQTYFWIAVPILIVILWGQLTTQHLLEKIFKGRYTSAEYLSVSLTGWIFPVFFLSIFYFLIHVYINKTFAIVVLIFLFILPLLTFRFKTPPLFVTALLFFIFSSIFARFAFIKDILLPPYFDSPTHYSSIQTILNLYQHQSNFTFGENYYHLGYHFISATLIDLFQFDTSSFMVVFGQILLAILPVWFFFLTKQITGSNIVSFLTCLVSGFGFHMPAHLINWGKYPALLSVFGIQFVLCLAIISSKTNSAQKINLNVITIALTALIHSRTLVVFALLIVLFWINLQIAKRGLQKILFLFITIILAIQIYLIQNNSVLFLLTERYWQQDSWMLITILLLTPFSIKKYPNQVFFLFSFISLLAFTLFIPISLPTYGTQTILDRPFVQSILYIPLTLLAGLGFASLTQIFSQSKYLISIILFLGITSNIYFKYDFYPSPCCQFVSQDDLSAITWIKTHTPQDSKILISATKLYVTAYEPELPAPSDAGIWIPQLTSRNILYKVNIDFQATTTHQDICGKKNTYIYVGSMPQSFNQNQLASHPNWYQPVFLSPKAQVYQVIGCD